MSLSRRRRALLRLIRQRGWVSSGCRDTKRDAGYPQRARKAHKTYAHALTSLWELGYLEGVKINNTWHYTHANMEDSH